jgi:hypothetical protein
LNRAIFGLLAFLLLNGVARAGGGPAELNQYDVPAEARWSPFFANMPTCDDGGVLSTISGRFGQTQREFWNSQLAISGFDRVREIGFRSNGLASTRTSPTRPPAASFVRSSSAKSASINGSANMA